ncbi:MAG: hypothetical protein GY856_08365, partial [bacterium]|nr:hypothetical protein [bacterium]
LRGLFVNLQIFRNELLNLPFRRIVVTRDDQEFYDVTATTGEDGHIGLLLTPRSPQIEEVVPA